MEFLYEKHEVHTLYKGHSVNAVGDVIDIS
jgi:hypothetical protein